jgi:sucrose-6-phosphate hydrolase SacC (GH32 family)
MPFNLQMSFPNTLELKTTPEGIRLFRWPIKEIEKLYKKSYTFKNQTAKQLMPKLTKVKADLIDLSIDFNACDSLKMNVRGININWNNGQFIYKNKKTPAPIVDGKVKLRLLLDRTSLELFTNDGAAAATFYALTVAKNNSITISTNENIKINSLIINELKSSWKSIKNKK